MKGASISDLHLCYRGAGRSVNGRNQRELDVELAWSLVVDVICERRPEILTIGGDVFDNVRPNFHAVKAWQQGLRRIAVEVGCPVVVIGGNHESPRTAETLTPNIVASDHAIIVTEPCVIPLAGAAVHCLPFVALSYEERYSVAPIAGTVNILLIHAAVRSSARPGALPPMYGGAAAYDVARAEGFDIVACGDFHEPRVLSFPDGWMGKGMIDQWNAGSGHGPLAFYSGSIERTSSNIWQESAPKGVILWDTDERTFEFVEIPTRPMYDTLYDEPDEMTAAGVNRRLEVLVSEPLLADSLLRLKVENFPRSERDGIDWKLVTELKNRCVHFVLDLRTADRDVQKLGDRRERQGRSLADEAESYFEEDEPPVKVAAFEYLGLDVPAEVSA